MNLGAALGRAQVRVPDSGAGTMAAWFPSLRPEEPFFSAVARYADAMAFPHPHDLAANLYGTHTDYPAPAFPGLLEAFVARLPPGHGHTATQLILRHTPFPYFAPFYPRRRVAQAAGEMRVRRVESDVHPVFWDVYEHDMTAPLRYCPECVASDTSTGPGAPCWRRVHLLPGVLACPEHRIRLRLSWAARSVWSPSESDPVPKVRSLATVVEDRTAVCALGDESLQLALEVADDSLWLLRHPQLADSLPTVLERHRALLGDTGWVDARGRPRYEDLRRMLADYSAGLVTAAFGPSPRSSLLFYSGWIRRMFRGDEQPLIPLFHILQWRALGLTAEEFFAGAPPPVVRRVPRTLAQQGPCRNPACERLGVPPDAPADAADILVVGCPKCRSLYAERTDGRRRRWKLLRVGDGWMARFSELVAEGNQLPEVARALGASKRRVLQEALTRRAWPQCWSRELRRAAEAVQRRGDWRRSGAHFLRQWVSASSRGWGLDWALAEAGAAFRWLLRFDPNYLGDNTDEPYFVEVRGVAPQLDTAYDSPEDPDDGDHGLVFDPIGQAAAFLRSHYGPPIAITEQALRLLLTGVGRYPNWTIAKLDESDFAPYVDTPATFARRRIRWAAYGYTFLNQTPSAARIAAAAHLSPNESEAHSGDLELAAEQLRQVAAGTREIPRTWVPPHFPWSRTPFEENLREVLDRQRDFRYTFGIANIEEEGFMTQRGGGPTNIERRRRAGFGEGEGANYKPWETPRSAPSHGKTHRIYGEKVGRMHLLLSDRELWCWYLLEWNPAVRDIREQYPLHELAETQEIAAELGYTHPVQTRKVKGITVREDKVITVDFLVTLAEPAGHARTVALSVKTADQLRDPAEQMRVFEKEEITRRFWERRGIPFRIVTEVQLPRVLVENLSLILSYRDLSGHGIPEGQIDALLAHLYDRFADAEGVPVNRVCAMVDERLGLRRGSAVRLVWHAIATRAWSVDLTARLGPERALRGLDQGERARRIA